MSQFRPAKKRTTVSVGESVRIVRELQGGGRLAVEGCEQFEGCGVYYAATTGPSGETKPAEVKPGETKLTLRAPSAGAATETAARIAKNFSDAKTTTHDTHVVVTLADASAAALVDWLKRETSDIELVGRGRRIEVYKEYPLRGERKARGEVHAGGCLADTALLVDDRKDARHRQSPRRHSTRWRSPWRSGTRRARTSQGPHPAGRRASSSRG